MLERGENYGQDDENEAQRLIGDVEDQLGLDPDLDRRVFSSDKLFPEEPDTLEQRRGAVGFCMYLHNLVLTSRIEEILFDPPDIRLTYDWWVNNLPHTPDVDFTLAHVHGVSKRWLLFLERAEDFTSEFYQDTVMLHNLLEQASRLPQRSTRYRPGSRPPPTPKGR